MDNKGFGLLTNNDRAYVSHLHQTPVPYQEMLDALEDGNIVSEAVSQYAWACPRNLLISEIVSLLDLHFHAKYVGYGASRLPVLAMYAIYQSLIDEHQERYAGMQLLPLESHTSADSQSGRIGDIDITRPDGTTFESVEVKFDIKVDNNIVENAKNKILPSKVERYYILSTKEEKAQDVESINDEIKRLKKVHGCELIVNGILPTIKYYLRLLHNPQNFLEHYVELMTKDKAIKFEHKTKWNSLISSL